MPATERSGRPMVSGNSDAGSAASLRVGPSAEGQIKPAQALLFARPVAPRRLAHCASRTAPRDRAPARSVHPVRSPQCSSGPTQARRREQIPRPPTTRRRAFAAAPARPPRSGRACPMPAPACAPARRAFRRARRWHNRAVPHALALPSTVRFTKRATPFCALLLGCALSLPAHAADDTAPWTVLLIATCFGALLAFAAVVVAQRLRTAREIASMRRSLTASADVWWRANPRLIVTDIEAGDRRLRWFDPSMLLGKSPWQLAPDVETPAGLKVALDVHAPFFDLLLRVPAPDGTRRIVALSGAPVFTSTGSFAGYAGVARDLSALVGALGGDDSESQRLRVESEERTRQLELAVRELDSFAHSVSHDLRAPLRVVEGFANIVLEDYAATGRPLDDLGREHIRRVIAASGRMNAMIDTLLAMSRMTGRELQRERVDLSRLARDLADDLRAQDPKRIVQFVIADGVSCDGDRTLLSGVLQNLLGNAWKFTNKIGAAAAAA